MSSATQYLGKSKDVPEIWVARSFVKITHWYALLHRSIVCCARADHYGLYIAFYSMKFFRRNIDFRRDDGTSDPPVIEGDFCTCFF